MKVVQLDVPQPLNTGKGHKVVTEITDCDNGRGTIVWVAQTTFTDILYQIGRSCLSSVADLTTPPLNFYWRLTWLTTLDNYVQGHMIK